MHIEKPESVNGALWQNGHGGNKLLGTAKVNGRCTMTGSQTHIEEQVQGTQKVPVVARRGRGRDRFGRLELRQMSANMIRQSTT